MVASPPLDADRAIASRRVAARIVCVSSGHGAHVRLGYPEERMVVHGFDTTVFRPDPTRTALRDELRLPGDAV
jgi:hypothetical protein